MLESIFTSGVDQPLTIAKTLLSLGGALGIGFIISLIYIVTHKKEGYASSFPVTLIMLPAIIAIIILLIGDNIARAFGLAGAFSLIRFRSAASDPKDIAYVFFSLAIGLACGVGYVAYAAMFALILCLVMLILEKSSFAKPSNPGMLLKVTIPENLNYHALFDDIFDRYTDSWQLKRVKTSNFGSLFDIFYQIQFKAEYSPKDFLDELRCRNGNLDISLTVNDFENII